MKLLKVIITTFFFIFSYLSLNALTFKNGKEVTLENVFSCYANNVEDESLKNLFRGLILIGGTLEPEKYN